MAKPKAPKPVKKAVIKPLVKKAAPTGMAGYFPGSVGPEKYISGLYAPQEQSLAAQQAQRQAALKGLVGDFLASLNSVGSQLAPYTNAANQQSSDARNAAAALEAANPNAVTQADLAAINAPESQRQQVTGINQAAFPGNAALLQYTGGAIPADTFRADAAGRAAYLASLPLRGEALGVQGLGLLNALASKENTNLAGQKTDALLKARSDLADFVQKNQDRRLDLQKLAVSQANADRKYALDVNKYTTGAKLSVARLNLQSKKFAQQTLQSDRSYGLQLQKLGLQSKSLQLRAASLEYKLKNGGFTPLQMNKINTDSAFVISQARTAKVAPTYQQVMQEMLKRHVPVSVADAKIRKMNPVLQGTPITAPMLRAYDVMVGASTPKFAKVQPLVVREARKRGLDPNAVIAVAQMEGAGGGIGDSGTSFGPWQLHIGGAFPTGVVSRGQEHAWAWSPAGIRYALDRMASVARGLTGAEAVNAIVRRFERPANPDREVAGALGHYGNG